MQAMSNKIAIRIKPLKKWSDVANMSRHGLREDPAKHVNRDLTVQNIHFNFTEIETLRSDRDEITSHGDFGIVEHTDGKGLNITEEFEHLAGRTGAKWRKGAIVGTEFMFLASPAFFVGERGSEERRDHARKWAHDCLHEMRNRYPNQMACARLDLDEKTPHLSVFMLPTYEKTYDGPERQSKRRRAPRRTISHNQTFGTPESLSALQDWGAEAMKRCGYNLARGKRKQSKGPDHTTPAEGRRLIAEAEVVAEEIRAQARRDADEMRNSVEMAKNGTANFEIAMSEVARVSDAAADMSLTNKLLETAQARAFKDGQGQDRRFAKEGVQNNLVVRFIQLGFQKAADLFERIQSITRFNDEIERARGYPEPLMQMQNINNALREAVKETLIQLGVANQRPDVGEVDEKGDPPPVLELVFSRAERKAKKLNNELAVRLGPTGPSLR